MWRQRSDCRLCRGGWPRLLDSKWQSYHLLPGPGCERRWTCDHKESVIPWVLIPLAFIVLGALMLWAAL